MTTQPATGRQPSRERRVVLIAWAVSSAATVLAWILTPGETQATTAVGKELVAAIVVIGLVKGRLVIRYFMEVRRAPRWLRYATDGWLAVLWITLLTIYLI